MFVIIKYGADEEKIVNPNVLSSVLLSHVRKTCGFEGIQENIDLASESGEVVDLVGKGKEYAKKYLESRATYIPVKVVGDDNEENSQTYVPLLDNATSEKIKFFVSNTTFRARQGKLKGGKDGADRSGKGESDGPVGTGGAGGGGATGKSGKNDNKRDGQDEKGDKKAGNGGGAGAGGNDSGDAKKNATNEKKVQGKTAAKK